MRESKESCDRLVRLVSMFLNYSALESGKLVLQLRENDLRRLHRRLDGPLAGRVQAELVCAWMCGSARDCRHFRFDYQKVQQCIVNLLDNALKHSSEGGSVTLRRRIALLGAANGRRNGAAREASRPGPASEQRADFHRGYRQGNCGRISPGNFRGIRASRSIVVRDGIGLGHHQAIDTGASRKSVGRQRSGARKLLFISITHNQTE